MPDPTPSERPEAWEAIGGSVVTGMVGKFTNLDLVKWLIAVIVDVVGGVTALLFKLIAPAGVAFAKAIAASEDAVAPELAEIAAAAASDVFGQDVPTSAFTTAHNRSGRETASDALGRGMVNRFTTGGGSIEPGMEGAQKYLGMMVNMSLEGWYQGWFFELLSSMVPMVEIGNIEKFAGLDDKLAESLGLSRLSRRVLGTVIDRTVVNPAEWHLNKLYRPSLLGAGDVARQVARGRWTIEQGREELARQGWSDMRIEALLNSTAKFHSVADLTRFVRRGFWTQEQAVQHLRDQGYAEQVAVDELLVDEIRLMESYGMAMANAAVDGYVAGRIDESQLRNLLAEAEITGVDRALLQHLAVLRREMRVKELSSNEAEEMVKFGVLSVVDYRRALEREGYSSNAVLAKELLLRAQLDKARDVETHRAEQAAERAAEKAARQVEAARRRSEIEAERAQQRRGPFATLARAAVRGLIPLARVEEVLIADYDGDTVTILMSIVEDDRQAYIDELRRADEARQRAAVRGIGLSDLEQAVLAGVLTIDQYRDALPPRGVPAADVAILVATLAAELEDRERADQTRREADLAAQNKGIDLTRFEALVRRGVRTLVQYDALLSSMGFGDAARADMSELLRLKIADDTAAVELRALAEPALRARGLSLEQERRAVILGLQTLDQFGAWLVAEGFTADAQILLLEELRVDVADAAAARMVRDSKDRVSEGRSLPLSTIARAARLGLVGPETYQARLVAAGYNGDDIAIDMELLLTEIADVQTARARRDQVERELAPRGLTLNDLARAVRRGLSTLEEYRGRALQVGLPIAAVDVLTRILADELRETAAAKARREAIGTELSARNLSLAELEGQVLAGAWTLADFVNALEQTGYERADAELVGSLLVDQLEAGGLP